MKITRPGVLPCRDRIAREPDAAGPLAAGRDLTTDAGLEGWGEAVRRRGVRANWRRGATRSCRCSPAGASSTSRNCTRSRPCRAVAAIGRGNGLLGPGGPCRRPALVPPVRRRVPPPHSPGGPPGRTGSPTAWPPSPGKWPRSGFHSQIVTSSGDLRHSTAQMLRAVRDSGRRSRGVAAGRMRLLRSRNGPRPVLRRFRSVTPHCS